jgi:tripartite-type tricarboxylate transporter receptor subunit TctC
MRGTPTGTSRGSNRFVKQFTGLTLDRREAASTYVKALPPRRNLRLVAQATTGVLVCAALLGSDIAASAQGVEQFYRGKTINFVIGNAAAGAPDAYARLVARHIGNYIPGNPKVIARNMPGAGGLVAANHVFNVAPQDGTTLGLMAPTLPLEETLGVAAAKYRASHFNWIGRIATSPNITFLSATSQVQTIADAFDKVSVLGATARSSTNTVFPLILNSLLGTKFKIVLGYEGTAAAMIALERGEVEGMSATYDGLQSQRPDWLASRKVNIVVQYLLRRHPGMPNVPTAVEVAKTAEQALILRTVSGTSEIGKFVLSTPGVPPDRVAALRSAFDEMVRSPDFLAEADKLRIEIGPLPGAALQKIVVEMQAISPEVIEKIKAIYPLN